MHQSIPAAPSPNPPPPPSPRADPRALAFFFFWPWMENFRGWGLSSCQIPRGEDEKSPFLAWGDFRASSRFARSTVSEEKWGTTRSLPFLRQHCNIFY